LKASKVPEKLQFYIISDDDFIDNEHKQKMLRDLGYTKAL